MSDEEDTLCFCPKCKSFDQDLTRYCPKCKLCPACCQCPKEIPKERLKEILNGMVGRDGIGWPPGAEWDRKAMWDLYNHIEALEKDKKEKVELPSTAGGGKFIDEQQEQEDWEKELRKSVHNTEWISNVDAVKLLEDLNKARGQTQFQRLRAQKNEQALIEEQNNSKYWKEQADILHKDTQKLEKENTEAVATINRLKDQLSEVRKEIAKKDRIIEELRGHEEGLQGHIDEKDAEITRLKDQLAEIQGRMNDVCEIAETVFGKKAVDHLRKHSSKIPIVTLTTMFREKIKELKEKIKHANMEIDQHKMCVAQKEKDIEALEGEIYDWWMLTAYKERAHRKEVEEKVKKLEAKIAVAEGCCPNCGPITFDDYRIDDKTGLKCPKCDFFYPIPGD